MGAAGGGLSVGSGAYLTEAEALVLEQALPPGMTEPMQELAFVLYEALVLQDPRARHQSPERQQPAGPWLQLLQAMAATVCVQVAHAAREIGGRQIYLAKLAAELAPRDRAIFAEFNGRNHAQLAKKYGLTEMRVRQILETMQKEEFARRQGNLPGLD